MDEAKVGIDIPEFNFDENNPTRQHLKSINIAQPLEFYKEMMPDEFIEEVAEQSRLYAELHKSQSWAKWQNEVTVDNLREIEGIMHYLDTALCPPTVSTLSRGMMFTTRWLLKASGNCKVSYVLVKVQFGKLKKIFLEMSKPKNE